MPNIDEKLDTLLTRTAAILRLLEKKKEPANVRFLTPTEGLAEERQTELLKIFNNLCGLPRHQKLAQSFPVEIRQPDDLDAPNPRIVPLSVLKNRCCLRKAFRPRTGESDSGEVFSAAVEACGSLMVRTLSEMGLRPNSELKCVWESDKVEKPRRGFAPEGMRWATDDKYDFSVVPWGTPVVKEKENEIDNNEKNNEENEEIEEEETELIFGTGINFESDDDEDEEVTL